MILLGRALHFNRAGLVGTLVINLPVKKDAFDREPGSTKEI